MNLWCDEIEIDGNYQTYLSWSAQQRFNKIAAIKSKLISVVNIEEIINILSDLGSILGADGQYERAVKCYDNIL